MSTNCEPDIILDYPTIINNYNGKKIKVNKVVDNVKIKVIIDLRSENTVIEYHFNENSESSESNEMSILDCLHITISPEVYITLDQHKKDFCHN